MADLIVNHVSSRFAAVSGFLAAGRGSPYAGMFLTYDRVFPDGATEADLLRIYRPRPGLPFTHIDACRTASSACCGPPSRRSRSTSTCTHPQGEAYLDAILERFHDAGIRAHPPGRRRLRDQEGRHQLLHDPRDLRLHRRADRTGARARHRSAGRDPQLLPAADRDRPPASTGSTISRCRRWCCTPCSQADAGAAEAAGSTISPRNAVTVLDTHDGIGVIDVGADAAPGRPGPAAARRRSTSWSRRSTSAAAARAARPPAPPPAISISTRSTAPIYDALGRRDDATT